MEIVFMVSVLFYFILFIYFCKNNVEKKNLKENKKKNEIWRLKQNKSINK